MNQTTVMAMVNALGDDASYYVAGNDVHVTLNDFAGFDEDWCEVERDYDDADAVEAFIEGLTNEASAVTTDECYTYYHMDGFVVVVGCESLDI